jgi:hypothetical protein
MDRGMEVRIFQVCNADFRLMVGHENILSKTLTQLAIIKTTRYEVNPLPIPEK